MHEILNKKHTKSTLQSKQSKQKARWMRCSTDKEMRCPKIYNRICSNMHNYINRIINKTFLFLINCFINLIIIALGS